MARYLLDTNIVIAAALGLPGVLDRLAALEIGDVAVSAISLAETLGAVAAEHNGRLAENIALLAENLDVLPFDRGAADAYGALLRKSRPEAPPARLIERSPRKGARSRPDAGRG